MPCELVHAYDIMGTYRPRKFYLSGAAPDGVRDIRIHYLPLGVDSVVVEGDSQRSLEYSVRSFPAGQPGFPLTIGSWAFGESSTQAQVAISGVVVSERASIQKLSLYEPCLDVDPRDSVLDEGALGIYHPCSGGKTTFSINQREMTITKILSDYSGPDARALYVSARLEYAKMREVVVRWGVCNTFGDKAEIGHHTFSFT